VSEDYRGPGTKPQLLAEHALEFQQEYSNQHGRDLRFAVYEHAEHPISFYNEVYSRLGCDRDDTLLDVGCANGDGLALIRILRMHAGRLIGVDPSDTLLESGKDFNAKAEALGFRPIDFMHGNGEDLQRLIAENSVDAAMILFTLYHTDADKTLREIIRVTKPGGHIAVSTASIINKFRQRGFEAAIALYLNDQLGIVNPHECILPPVRFTDSFDTEQAPAILSEHPLRLVRTIRQQSRITIAEPGKAFDDYLGSLGSMWPHFRLLGRDVPHGLFRQAVDEIVVPKMFEEIEAYGEFVEYENRTAYICENIKNSFQNSLSS
jgi:SAM-dependent methyltransferase